MNGSGGGSGGAGGPNPAGSAGRRPFVSVLDVDTGQMDTGFADTGLAEGFGVRCQKKVVRLSDIASLFCDETAVEKTLAGGDPVVYEVYEAPVPDEQGELGHCATVLLPGAVGDEYFMTAGHFHVRRQTAEVCLCLGGSGVIVLETEA